MKKVKTILKSGLEINETLFTTELIDFIEQAGEISEMCSDEAIKRSDDDFLACEIHNKYIIWKLSVDRYLQRQDLHVDAKIFRIENKVPLLKGGLEYGDKNSYQSRNLIKNISLEIDDKLRHIRDLIVEDRNKEKNPFPETVTFNPKIKKVARITLHKNNNKLSFSLENKGKKYFISDDLNSRKSKLFIFLSEPHLGTFKSIESVFESIRLNKDIIIDGKNIESTIKNTFKEIKRTLKEEGSPLIFTLEWSKNSVSLVAKSGKQ